MGTFSKEDIWERVDEQDVKFIRLQFTSIQGLLKNIAVTVDELQGALEGKIMLDSSVIEGFDSNREEDIYLVPDPKTFGVFPWRPREGAVARLICDTRDFSGEPFAGCPRVALKKVLAGYSTLGIQPKLAAGIEFYLFHLDEQGRPLLNTHDLAGYCDLTPVDRGENARRDMVLTLQEMGFDISTSFHDIGPGQHEIFLKADSALNMADNIATYKFVVRTIAQRHGLHASFMPQPLDGHNGSGLNLHLSLFRDGINIFDGPGGDYDLSKTAHEYMAGIIHHAKGITALANPVINSYKRLISGETKMFLAAWSCQNRRTMIRVPEERGEETRIILRSPDPACNPYLTIAGFLSAGLAGVEGKLPTSKPLDFHNSEDIVLKIAADSLELPGSLDLSLAHLSGDPVIRDAVGDRIYQSFKSLKDNEWNRYKSKVHQWEIDEYLVNY
ncbi:MAG: glutamine synthetase [Peptococcaceae bacterium]|nr:glutamine synthetase [Peptococcaceae bacterium]